MYEEFQMWSWLHTILHTLRFHWLWVCHHDITFPKFKGLKGPLNTTWRMLCYVMVSEGKPTLESTETWKIHFLKRYRKISFASLQLQINKNTIRIYSPQVEQQNAGAELPISSSSSAHPFRNGDHLDNRHEYSVASGFHHFLWGKLQQIIWGPRPPMGK